MNPKTPNKYDHIDTMLMATYEEVTQIPSNERMTEWIGDYALNAIKDNVNPDMLERRFNEALTATGYTYLSFRNSPFANNSNALRHLIERNTENPPLYEDIFFIDREREKVMWMYFNPDSSAGGQYVINYCDFDLINKASKESSSATDFFDILQNECYQELSDIGTEMYESDHGLFCSNTHDFAEMTESTMLNIINDINKTPVEQYAHSLQNSTPTQESETEYED